VSAGALRHLVLGADFGKHKDPSAIAVLDHDLRTDRVVIVHLEILPHHTPYRSVVQRLATLVRRAAPPEDRAMRRMLGRAAPPRPVVSIAVDATGLGDPVVEMLLEEPWEARLWPIVFTGGLKPRFDEKTGRWMVPKVDLVQDVKVRAEDEPPRYYCPPDLPNADTLATQFAAFRESVTAAGKLRYDYDEGGDVAEAEERAHGDLAVASCLGSWVASRHAVDVTQQVRFV